MILKDAYDALRIGNELKDPAKWKDRQNLMSKVGILLAAVYSIVKWRFPEFTLPDGALDEIVVAVVSGMLVVHMYLVKATSKKVGIKPKEDNV